MLSLNNGSRNGFAGAAQHEAGTEATTIANSAIRALVLRIVFGKRWIIVLRFF
jgi:hypothetical protein